MHSVSKSTETLISNEFIKIQIGYISMKDDTLVMSVEHQHKIWTN